MQSIMRCVLVCSIMLTYSCASNILIPAPVTQIKSLEDARAPVAQSKPLEDTRAPVVQSKPLEDARAPVEQSKPLEDARAPVASIIIEVTGIKDRKGQIVVYLCNKKTFLKRCDIIQTQPVVVGSIQFKFTDIPVGLYAIQVFHDENMDETLDMGFIFPEEGYGLSNYPSRPKLKPDFDDSKFMLRSGIKPEYKKIPLFY